MMKHSTNSVVQIDGHRNSRYTCIEPYFDTEYNLAWCYMRAQQRQCFSPELLDDLSRWCSELTNQDGILKGCNVKYMALASNAPGVFNLGGDLHLFSNLIRSKDREGLLSYAETCINPLYANTIHHNRDITTIALVQGDALGGGFETALSCDVLIAERSAKMGLPEILFNLFPGMGAYSFLSRKLGGAQAERMILSGKLYPAEELYDMGIVDVLAEDHQGEMAVYHHIKRENASRNGYRALRKVCARCNPVTYEELVDVVNIWVDSALRLTTRDIRMMERLVSRQSDKSPVVA